MKHSSPLSWNEELLKTIIPRMVYGPCNPVDLKFDEGTAIRVKFGAEKRFAESSKESHEPQK
jgi:hypothetical protein